MKNTLTSPAKLFTLCIAIIASFTLCENTAQAQLTISYSTSVIHFGPSELYFSGVNVTGTTAGGTFALNQEDNTLGTFMLMSTSDYYAEPIQFVISLSQPSGILGGSTRHVNASVHLADGYFLVDFDNNPQMFAFDNSSGSGVFSLTIEDIVHYCGQPCSMASRERIDHKLRQFHKSANVLAFNATQSKGENVKWLKTKDPSGMLAPKPSASMALAQEIEINLTDAIKQHFLDGMFPTHRQRAVLPAGHIHIGST